MVSANWEGQDQTNATSQIAAASEGREPNLLPSKILLGERSQNLYFSISCAITEGTEAQAWPSTELRTWPFKNFRSQT